MSNEFLRIPPVQVASQSLLGQQFQVSKHLGGSSSQIIALLLSNPSASTIQAVVNSVVVSTSYVPATGSMGGGASGGLFVLHFNPTISGLSSVSIANLNSASTLTPQCTASAGANVSITASGTTLYEQYFYVSSEHYPLDVVLGPGSTLDVDYTLPSSSTVALVFRWSEVAQGGI